MEVDFRAVECAVALVDFVVYAFVLERVLEGACGRFPNLVRADMLFRLGRKLDMEILESERLIQLERKLDNADYLGLYLVGRAEDMGVVLCELPDPEQPVHYAAGLVAVHKAQLSHPQWELAI